MSKILPHYFPPETKRGMFIVLPLKYSEKLKNLAEVREKLPSEVRDTQIDFNSGDFIQLMNDKCTRKGNFVRRYTLAIPEELADGQIKDGNGKVLASLAFTNFQLFTFDNGIAFISALLEYPNSQTGAVYEFVKPGYNENDAMEPARAAFIDALENTNIVSDREDSPFTWFTKYNQTKHADLLIKDAYRLNSAYSPIRFASAEETQQVVYNEHRIINLNCQFSDPSEHDVQYFSGAKDVDDWKYGWGCAVTSQEVSYIYAPGRLESEITDTLADHANDDLLLLMLALYQKYESMSINEQIHTRYSNLNRTKKSIYELKQEAMSLIAYETLAPSQISRWNNVCEIYKATLELTGVDETIAEVKDKIEMLTAEQDRRDSKRDTAISTVITVFGLVSIIAAILQTVDYLDSRSPVMWVSFFGSLAAVLVLGIYLGIRLGRKKG